MNQRFWRSLTATMLVTALGTLPSARAGSTQDSERKLGERSPLSGELPAAGDVGAASHARGSYPSEVEKVGEYRLCEGQAWLCYGTEFQEQLVAKIYVHDWAGRQAATLYVRDIPVLSFLSAEEAPQEEAKVGEVANPESVASANPDKASSYEVNSKYWLERWTKDWLEEMAESADPVWRASAIAARLNQLQAENIDASQITVRWDEERGVSAIEVDGEFLVAIDEQTFLPDTTEDLAEDALQATNRLRRLMGQAPPLEAIANLPEPEVEVAAVPLFSGESIMFSLNGIASWYGGRFNGRRSASGEIYNQYDFTAAHKELPFGTIVRVTNLRNGLSVVVRINDRGPFTRGRIIDLSAAAANTIGMMSSGVAPVRVDVLTMP